MSREDRIKGVLIGQACGDALGTGYETGKPVPASGAVMCGGGYGFGPGEWSDDTQQAVCVAAARSNPAKVAGLLMQWYRDPAVKDIGAQTGAVLRRVKSSRGMTAASRFFAREQEIRSRPAGWYPGTGNGSLMRTGPVCLPFLGNRKAISKAARRVSDLTHADPWSGDACVLWSLAIARAIEIGGKWMILADMETAGLELIPAERREFWRERIADAADSEPAAFAKGNGSAVGAFMTALSAVAHSISLEEGLHLAVAAAGDTDTVAAIAGALLGAIHGASSIPDEWHEKVWGWPGMNAADLGDLALAAAGLR